MLQDFIISVHDTFLIFEVHDTSGEIDRNPSFPLDTQGLTLQLQIISENHVKS